GGLGGSAVELLVTMTALGRALVVEPFLPCAVLAVRLLRELGTPEQRQALLPALAAGERLAVPAHAEAEGRYEVAHVATTATPVAGGGYALSGRKAVAWHAPAADVLLVSARSSGPIDDAGGISLFLVDPRAPGVSLVPYPTIDGHRAADVILRDARVAAGDCLGPEGGAGPEIAATWDVGVATLCAEAVGALEAVLTATVDYLKTRRQFDVA